MFFENKISRNRQQYPRSTDWEFSEIQAIPGNSTNSSNAMQFKENQGIQVIPNPTHHRWKLSENSSNSRNSTNSSNSREFRENEEIQVVPKLRHHP